MIVGHIAQIEQFRYLPSNIIKGLEFLKKTDFSQYNEGKVEIDGRNMFFQISNLTTKPITELYPEAHAVYTDVHYLLSGEEKIGYAPNTNQLKEHQNFMNEQDISFYEQKLDDFSYIKMIPGLFAIFLPTDFHMPNIQSTENQASYNKKLVMKIKVDITNY